MTALAQRYAQGALNTATDAQGEALVTDLEAFAELVRTHEPLQAVLTHPACATARADVVQAIMVKMGLCDLAQRLLGLLIRRDRIAIVGDVAVATRELVDARAGRLRAQVRSAIALSEVQLDALQKQLSARMGQPVHAIVTVDEELLGGMVCQVGELTLDSSLKNQFGILADRLGTRLH
jgi:F-type H+-transporting ATPase subunit delta